MFWFVSLFVTLTTAELTAFWTDYITHTLRESNKNLIRRRSPRPYTPTAAALMSACCVEYEWQELTDMLKTPKTPQRTSALS